MTNVVNLNRFRKKKARADKEKQAEENRAKYGRTKGEKAKYKRDMEKLANHVEGHKREDKDSQENED